MLPLAAAEAPFACTRAVSTTVRGQRTGHLQLSLSPQLQAVLRVLRARESPADVS
jgi:hypothetical protein